ncbi:unnamed protein product [Adineta steineri]|uniref:Rho-GAP domain-containing protein n=1 Tax=Adineta steineri TaxID=433720 RepID=A0A815JET4_9BILA|nr:unnamed protein product [Adineta steineri]CAF3878866.1 unnamed protein product [Adineta steineri]
MNRFKPFFNVAKTDDTPECYNRVRYIRDSCKVLADLRKSEKDFLNKSIDNDISKAFKEFRATDNARAYYSPNGLTGSPSILNSTIDDLIQIHEQIDEERKKWFEKFRKISDQAKEKQAYIRQTISDLRDNYERAKKNYETAESNFKKFQNRPDRMSVPNYDERFRELEDIRIECDRNRISAHDIYVTEINRTSSEEHSITRDFFLRFLCEEQTFYTDIQQLLSNEIPKIQNRIDTDKLAPSFQCDISEHCIKRIQRPIAYPIDICIDLLKNSVGEEGLFRVSPALIKQKKLISELDLQLIQKGSTLSSLGYEPHVAANALKQYLRDLPECLLTNELLPQWNEISVLNEDVRIQRISELLVQLPTINYENLRQIIRFLSRVVDESSTSRMTASALSTCIGYSLLGVKDQMPGAYKQGSTIVELMIIHHEILFPSDNHISYQTKPPDVIPTMRTSKNYSSSVEDLINIEPSKSSPRNSRKQLAPHPPLVRQASSQMDLTYGSQIYKDETSTDQPPAEQIAGSNSSSNLYVARKSNNNNNNGNVRPEIHRPLGPPPIPPMARPRTVYKKEQETSPIKENNELSTNDISILSPPLEDGIPVGNLLPDLYTGATNSNMNTSQINDSRISSHQYNTSSPATSEEITEF